MNKQTEQLKSGRCQIHLDGEVLKGRIPSFLNESKINKRANRFLNHQEKRLNKFIREKRYDVAFRILLCLLAQSKSFRVMIFHKALPGGYHNREMKDVYRIWNKLDRIIKNGDCTLMSKRTYILKPDGRKRPLGVPKPEGRIINAAFADIITRIASTIISNSQYGFLPKRSSGKAWDEIGNRTGKSDLVFEFDLASFFNKVNIFYIDWHIREILKLPEDICNYILGVNTNLPYNKGSAIEAEDNEVWKYTGPNGKQPYFCGIQIADLDVVNESTRRVNPTRVVGKQGLPQGLPGSPILAILLLDQAFKELKINPILYADDGIIIIPEEEYMGREEETKISLIRKLEWMRMFGIELSSKIKNGSPVTKGIEDGVINFLGLSGNYKTDKILVEEKWIERGKVSKKTIEKMVGNSYKGRKNDGRGEFAENNLLWSNPEVMNPYPLTNGRKKFQNLFSSLLIRTIGEDGAKKIMKKFFGVEQGNYPIITDGKNIKRLLKKGTHAYDYQISSTLACEYLMKNLKIRKSSTLRFQELYGNKYLGEKSFEYYLVYLRNDLLMSYGPSNPDERLKEYEEKIPMIKIVRLRAKLLKAYYGTYGDLQSPFNGGHTAMARSRSKG